MMHPVQVLWSSIVAMARVNIVTTLSKRKSGSMQRVEACGPTELCESGHMGYPAPSAQYPTPSTQCPALSTQSHAKALDAKPEQATVNDDEL